jgi:glycosyltransferase involved in cell wall biosynthesis
LFKSWDGFFMALGSFLTVRKLRREFKFDCIDAHFAYPDGYAATLLGRWLGCPVTITLRGTEKSLSRYPGRRKRIIRALRSAQRIFAVSESLKIHAHELGIDGGGIHVVGNGVDCDKFFPVDKVSARHQYNIPENSKVLISVGGLVPRKGFHRVIALLPELLKRYPNLIYLIVGGTSPEGDIRSELEAQAARLGVERHVRFLGALPSDQLRVPLSAADLFVLATANEGWANVFLEAMACGLPVITTDVGGNREVVCNDVLGEVVPFHDAGALQQALANALTKPWDKDSIVAYARANGWERRVDDLRREFGSLARLRCQLTVAS